MLFIGIDLGTSACKLLLVGEDGTIQNEVTKEYPLSFPHPGWAEQRPEEWWDAVVTGVPELLRGFDRRYPGAVEIPRAYELIIRALKQGLGKGHKAMPVMQALQRRYPDHPSTQEAAWVMRDELEKLSS